MEVTFSFQEHIFLYWGAHENLEYFLHFIQFSTVNTDAISAAVKANVLSPLAPDDGAMTAELSPSSLGPGFDSRSVASWSLCALGGGGVNAIHDDDDEDDDGRHTDVESSPLFSALTVISSLIL